MTRAVYSHDDYRDVYLLSDHWLRVRKAALERAGNRCQICNGSKKLDVHHRTYERLSAERDADVTVLCRKCHDLFHSSRKVKAPSRKTKRHVQAPQPEVVGLCASPSEKERYDKMRAAELERRRQVKAERAERRREVEARRRANARGRAA